MSKYGEFLKAQGASEDEIKILDTAVAARAYDKMQSDLVAATAARDKLDTDFKAYEGKVQTWYDENDAKLRAMQNKVIVSESEAQRAKAAILKAQEEGLIDIAKDLGYTIEPPKKVVEGAPDGFDASKFVTLEQFQTVADGIGGNLAALEDMVMEHKQLFPDVPLRVSALRAEALAANKTVAQYWE